mmetsp:Transcript_125375/g.244156  ORF Transcript_125375/g.244156 Transcript_125375/m.244156 type:complete len:216 (+) Transcript_125375:46-693(+)
MANMDGRSDGGRKKLCAPAADRNKQPILEALQKLIPKSARVLEIGAGTGQHAAHFAQAEPSWTWIPSEPDPQSLESIEAYTSGLNNVLQPVDIDVAAADWPGTAAACAGGEQVDVIYSANVVHIAPWEVCQGLIRGAGELVKPGGCVIFYGPFYISGQSFGNTAEFDQTLRSRNPTWGIRDVDDMVNFAKPFGFTLEECVNMPKDNFCVVLRRND